MINILLSEHLKYKRTFTGKLIISAPLFFVIIALQAKLLMPANHIKPWWILLDQVFNWWPVIFIPIGTALFATLVNLQEKKAGNYLNLRIHNITPYTIWIGKIVVMAYHSLLAILILIAAIVTSGLITAGGPIPWSEILVGSFTIWLTSLALIPLQLWAATWMGTSFSMAVGFIGLVAGVIAAPKPYWVYVPWSWATRLMCPIIGVHPNGVHLETSDLLRSPSVIPIGIILALATLIILTMITAVWFNRRELK
ncbi:MAG TPA: lantibiotic immunity ABC transporter MutE/EpiE family permease subunit [Desulfosporosinus sp.]|nr:lantibiotic immunity ABC transporter MutE/EpiE family permease subunit [Desulfosporosinus sp.]